MRVRLMVKLLFSSLFFLAATIGFAQTTIDIHRAITYDKKASDLSTGGYIYYEYNGYRLSELIPMLMGERINRFEVSTLRTDPYLYVYLKSNEISRYRAKDLLLEKLMQKYKVRIHEDRSVSVVYILRDDNMYAKDRLDDYNPDGSQLTDPDWDTDRARGKNVSMDNLAIMIEKQFGGKVLNRSYRTPIANADLDFSSHSSLQRDLRKYRLALDKEERVYAVKVLSNYDF